MNHYEKGRHIPDIDTLKRMADELGVPINYFFCESEQTAELARLIANMTETEQAALISELSTGTQGLCVVDEPFLAAGLA